jgi:hypothetical protein
MDAPVRFAEKPFGETKPTSVIFLENGNEVASCVAHVAK